MSRIDQNSKYALMQPAKAVELAARMQADDPDWQYIAVHDPKGAGLSYIAVYDDNGDFVGKA